MAGKLPENTHETIGPKTTQRVSVSYHETSIDLDRTVWSLTRMRPMKQNVALTISSLVAILLFPIHLAHDFVFGLDSMTRAGTFTYLLIMLVSLYGTVELSGRRWGYAIMLLLGVG